MKQPEAILFMCIVFSLVFVTSFVVKTSVYGSDFSIQPLIIDMDLKPRAKQDFSITVKSQRDIKLKVTLFDSQQQETGFLTFHESSSGKETSPHSYIKINNPSIDVKKDSISTITGSIKMPRFIKGTKLIAVMIEEDRAKSDKGGVSIKVRYAVTLKIKLKTKKKFRERGQFEEIEIVNEKGKLYVTGLLTNKSIHEYLVDSEVRIRDSKRKLIKKLKLHSYASKRRNETVTRVFPNSKVRLIGDISFIENEGDYIMSFKHKLGNKGRAVNNKTITITKELLEQPTM